MKRPVGTLHGALTLSAAPPVGLGVAPPFTPEGFVLKPVATLAAVGIVGVVALKLLGLIVLPLFGMLLGFLFWALKIALIVGLIWWGFTMFRKWTERGSEA
jgi:hypothetical protein